MNTRYLVIEVRLFNDRWHGEGDWPPSSFRLFQALIAGAYSGRWRNDEQQDENDRAFRWLEQLDPPVVLAPLKRDLLPVQYFVPNNDLDAVGNDRRRSAEIRASKLLTARLIDGDPHFMYPYFLYAWAFSDGESNALRIIDLCERLHTFGRGIDPAFAVGSIITSADLNNRISTYSGSIARPNALVGGASTDSFVPCPTSGSFDRLRERFEATTTRLAPNLARRNYVFFRQPPKAIWQEVPYDRKARHIVFELREIGGLQRFFPIRLERAAIITKAVRDLAFQRLANVPSYSPFIEKVALGRGMTDADRTRRIRFIPLPSIGSKFTDTSIRRMLVEMPPDCPISKGDLLWALSGQRLEKTDPEKGAPHGRQLVEAVDTAILRWYGTRKQARRWQTVTPVVLPVRTPRGRLNGQQRANFDNQATLLIAEALRHAGITSPLVATRIQREPFLQRGCAADLFETDRFDRGRVVHVEIEFQNAILGPLTIGDGRWLGLGLLHPVDELPDSESASIEESFDAVDAADVTPDDIEVEESDDDESPDYRK